MSVAPTTVNLCSGITLAIPTFPLWWMDIFLVFVLLKAVWKSRAPYPPLPVFLATTFATVRSALLPSRKRKFKFDSATLLALVPCILKLGVPVIFLMVTFPPSATVNNSAVPSYKLNIFPLPLWVIATPTVVLFAATSNWSTSVTFVSRVVIVPWTVRLPANSALFATMLSVFFNTTDPVRP